MSKLKNITLYTSIPVSISRIIQGKENGVAYQTACIDSWEKAGLRVVSVNCGAELEQLKDRGLRAKFVSNGTQKDRTQIATFLSFITDSAADIAGIINADCLLVHDRTFVESITRAAQNSIVLFERLNLDSNTMRPTGQHCYGFDAFFFDTGFIHKLKRIGSWQIGQTFWDYWFPLIMVHAGAKLKIAAPNLIHVNHDVRWGWENWSANATELRGSLLSLPNFDCAFPEDFVTATTKKQTKSEFARFVFSWLRLSAEKVKLSAEGTQGEFFDRLFSALAEPEEPQFKYKLSRWTSFQHRRFKSTLNQLRRWSAPYGSFPPGDVFHEIFEDHDIKKS